MADRRWFLQQITSPDMAVELGASFCLDTVNRVGRSTKSDICLSHPSVSRHHAELRISQQKLIVRDLNSRNGTFVDGQKVTSALVLAGQELRFGHAALIVAQEERSEDLESTRRGAIEKSEPQPVSPRPLPWIETLTPAQRNVLYWLVQGRSEKEIATRLSVSPRTIHNHVQAIYDRSGIHGRSQLMAVLLQHQASLPVDWRGTTVDSSVTSIVEMLGDGSRRTG